MNVPETSFIGGAGAAADDVLFGLGGGLSAGELVYLWTLCYGPHMVLLATLSAITVYRREMSCNHCYACPTTSTTTSTSSNEEEKEEENGQEESSSLSSMVHTVLNNERWEEAETGDFLELAGLYCSGSALLPVVSSILYWIQQSLYSSAPTTTPLLKSAEDYHADHPIQFEGMAAAAAAHAAEDFLERAGHFCSGEPLTSIFWPLIQHDKQVFVRSLASSFALRISNGPDETNSNSHNNLGGDDPGSVSSLHAASTTATSVSWKENELPLLLPPDVLVHAMSFLHPKDVVSFGCTSRACRSAILSSSRQRENNRNEDNNNNSSDTARAVWRCLWYRDYAWAVESWDVGRCALERSAQNARTTPASLLAHTAFDMEFYFNFGLSFMNYVLAGRNTLDSCLVGLHGHVYDLTDFLVYHPGSPETVLVQAGRDATAFFETVRHSVRARRLAKHMCVLVDQSRLAGNEDACGLRPTKFLLRQSNNSELQKEPLPPCVDEPEPDGGRQSLTPLSLLSDGTPRRMAGCTVESIRAGYLQQQQLYQMQASKKWSRSALNGSEIHVYFDVFCQEWRTWYTDSSLQTVFV